MNIDYTLITTYILVFVAYIFFCRFSFTLNAFFVDIRNDSFKESERMRDRFFQFYQSLVKTPSLNYKDRNLKLDPERYYYKLCVLGTILLIVINSFTLGMFFDNIGGLSTQILVDPIRINYSHLIAAVIVFAEIMTGALYYIAYQKQQETEDSIYALLKFIAVFGFICLAIVETIMWANLSVLFEMSERLVLGSSNIFRNFVDYFLSALGVGITLIEFAIGYFLSQFRKSSGDSSLLYNGRFLILTIGLIAILYIPNIFLLLFGALLVVITNSINFIILPGNYIYDKILNKKKSKPFTS